MKHLLTTFAIILLVVISGCDQSSKIDSMSTNEITGIFVSAVKKVSVEIESVGLNWEDSDKASISRYLDSSDETLGYSVKMEVVSRSGPFTIQTHIEPNGCVISAKVLSYSAQRGREVKFSTFTNQFSAKCTGSPIKLGNDIDAITGATISCDAMTRGVRKSVSIVKLLENR